MRISPLKGVLGLGLATALVWVPACSSDEEDDGASGGSSGSGGSGASGGAGGSAATGGSGGTGGAAPVPLAVCSGTTCDRGPTIDAVGIEVATCCSAADKCGLDTAPLETAGIVFDPVCQERDQPGERTADCPDSPPIEISAGIVIDPFEGCCRPEGKCGHLVNNANVADIASIDLRLGCVDTEGVVPDAGTPPSCTPGGGAGGAGGAAGAAGAAGGPGAAGAGGQAGGN